MYNAVTASHFCNFPWKLLCYEFFYLIKYDYATYLLWWWALATDHDNNTSHKIKLEEETWFNTHKINTKYETLFIP